jgi:hypothetical protein
MTTSSIHFTNCITTGESEEESIKMKTINKFGLLLKIPANYILTLTAHWEHICDQVYFIPKV